jgi:hypothetical protein
MTPRTTHSPMQLFSTPWRCWAAVCLLPLLGCGKQSPHGPAQTAFDALVASCTQFIAAREPHVRPGASGEWVKTGYSPAQVQSEVTRTESALTPYVAKIVIKDNEAQATAATEAAARAVTLTPAHLLSNRTYTFIYRFEGQQWHWENGQKLTKIPGQRDTIASLALADISGPSPKGFAGCLPRR